MKKITLLLILLTIILPFKVFAANEVTSDTVTLSNCVDGNSARFMLNLGEIKVKFLGIEVEETIKDDETDEINESLVSDYVCNALKNAKKIKIEYDPNSEKEDKFGRIQAWVYVDDTLLQKDLLSLGYAKIMYINDDYLHIDELKEAQNSAKEKKLGIWKEEKEESQEEKEEQDEKEEKVGFFQMIFNFLGDIFNKLINFIDDLISNVF
ncbi:MAG: thermonuclease family protein [Bacilli bacterium]|nr:thermonuclease family protein [Bacilli bacterium]